MMDKRQSLEWWRVKRMNAEWWQHVNKVARFASAPALRGMSFILRGFDVSPLPDLRGAYRAADNDNGPRSAA